MVKVEPEATTPLWRKAEEILSESRAPEELESSEITQDGRFGLKDWQLVV